MKLNWHNSKWEQFIVVHGHGLIQERNINTGETVEFKVSGDKIEAIYMIPGWTHNIINLSETEDLVTVMTCNLALRVSYFNVGYQKHNEEKAIEILDNVPKNFRDKQWYAVKRQLLENSIRKHSLAKRDILANEYTKELKKLDDVVEQKYGNINLREVDLLPDM